MTEQEIRYQIATIEARVVKLAEDAAAEGIDPGAILSAMLSVPIKLMVSRGGSVDTADRLRAIAKRVQAGQITPATVGALH